MQKCEVCEGERAKLNSLTLRKGKSTEKIEAVRRKGASKHKYLGYQLVALFDMQAAKIFLKTQPDIPYFRQVPSAAQ
jgi:hypothetical protein